jgi:hypothetical protein
MTPLPPRFTPEPDPATLLGTSSNAARLFNEALNIIAAARSDRASRFIACCWMGKAAEHADLLHLLGVIAHQTDIPKRGSADRPGHRKERAVADYHNNRGLALLRLDRAAEALTGFDRRSRCAPTLPTPIRIGATRCINLIGWRMPRPPIAARWRSIRAMPRRTTIWATSCRAARWRRRSIAGVRRSRCAPAIRRRWPILAPP